MHALICKMNFLRYSEVHFVELRVGRDRLSGDDEHLTQGGAELEVFSLAVPLRSGLEEVSRELNLLVGDVVLNN